MPPSPEAPHRILQPTVEPPTAIDTADLAQRHFQLSKEYGTRGRDALGPAAMAELVRLDALLYPKTS